ncbi:MAG TPA: hypothetical protein VFQ53_08540 [Kofleriaceae bacterium]|nr:hypothetical protein [Kofleriaceae bacterium]
MRALWLFVLAGCRFHAADSVDDGGRDTPPPPIDAIDADVDIDAAPLGPWGAPQLVTELSSIANDDDPTLTGDLLEIYFASDRVVANSEDIYVATRPSASAAFGAPTLVAELSSAAFDSNVDVSADGLTITLTSNRDGNFDLYIATRPDRQSAWSTPVLVPGVNSNAGEFGMVLSDDLKTAVLCSNRGSSEALFRATRSAATASFPTPTKLTELETSANECDAMLPDPRTIYFTRDSVQTGIDLFVATSTDGTTFDAAQPITELNTVGRDGDPWVAADQRTMVFASNRAGTPLDDIYISTR